MRQSLRTELQEQAKRALSFQARDLILHQLSERVHTDLPDDWIDHEIRHRWLQAEQPVLERLTFPRELQEQALRGWQTDPAIREDAGHRLRLSLALRAITEAEHLELTPAKLRRLITSAAGELGDSPDELQRMLERDEPLRRQLTDLGWHLLAVEHVMKQARVHLRR